MRTTRFLAPALLIATLASAGTAMAQYYGPPPPQQNYGQGPGGPGGPGGWDTAPTEFRNAMRRGFQDGIQGARRDFENHRPPNVNNRDEFRNPKFLPPPDRRDYREGFRRGYDVAVRHMYGQGQGRGDRRPY